MAKLCRRAKCPGLKRVRHKKTRVRNRDNGQIGLRGPTYGKAAPQLVNSVNRAQSLVKRFNAENNPDVYMKILIFT